MKESGHPLAFKHLKNHINQLLMDWEEAEVEYDEEEDE